MERRLSARDLSFDASPDADEEESYGPASYLPAADADPAEQVERRSGTAPRPSICSGASSGSMTAAARSCSGAG